MILFTTRDFSLLSIETISENCQTTRKSMSQNNSVKTSVALPSRTSSSTMKGAFLTLAAQSIKFLSHAVKPQVT